MNLKVLYITNEIPHYTGGGMPIRDFNLLKHLSDRYEFTLVCFEDWDPIRQQYKVELLEDYCHQVILVPRTEQLRRVQNKFLRKFQRYLHPQSWFIRQISPTHLSFEIKGILAQNSFSIVHVNHIEMGGLLGQVHDAKRVLGIEMLSPKIAKFGRLNQKISGRLFYELERRKIVRYEKKILADTDLFTMASANERELVMKMSPNAKVWVVPNGVNGKYMNYEVTSSFDATGRKLLFVGSMGYPPNEDAIVYFYYEIWPLIQKSVPNVEVCLVGRDPSAKIRAFASPDFKIIGWVEDIRPILHSSRIMMVPLRIGSGTRLKILEAMSSGLPVVSTSIGVEGLDVTNMKDVIIADDPQEFADAVALLLNNDSLAQSISVNGRILIEASYDWSIITDELDSAYRSLYPQN